MRPPQRIVQLFVFETKPLQAFVVGECLNHCLELLLELVKGGPLKVKRSGSGSRLGCAIRWLSGLVTASIITWRWRVRRHRKRTTCPTGETASRQVMSMQAMSNAVNCDTTNW